MVESLPPQSMSFTELDAVNDMLLMIKEYPVASLDELEAVSTAAIALKILRETTWFVSSDRWTFNYFDNITLQPDAVTKQIVLPANTISARGKEPTEDLYVHRNGVLFDIDKNTDQFTSSVQVQLILCLNWEEIPFEIRQYIKCLASRKFEKRMRGTDGLSSYTNEELQIARQQALRLHSWNGRHNIFQTSVPGNILQKRVNTYAWGPKR